MEFLVSEGMSEGTWPFLGQKNSHKISSGPTSGESSIMLFKIYMSEMNMMPIIYLQWTVVDVQNCLMGYLVLSEFSSKKVFFIAHKKM